MVEMCFNIALHKTFFHDCQKDTRCGIRPGQTGLWPDSATLGLSGGASL